MHATVYLEVYIAITTVQVWHFRHMDWELRKLSSAQYLQYAFAGELLCNISTPVYIHTPHKHNHHVSRARN